MLSMSVLAECLLTSFLLHGEVELSMTILSEHMWLFLLLTMSVLSEHDGAETS